MISVLFHADPSAVGRLTAELSELGTCGIIEEPQGIRAFFDRSEAVSALAGLPGRILDVREENASLAEFSREDWEPVLAGKKFYIVPPWIATPAPPGRLRLEIDTPQAFGTGRHESTQLCLEALEQTLKPGDTVLDLGSGSGILSAAAHLLKAGTIVSCDIHADAVSATSRNARTAVFQGSVDSIRDEAADVVVANISSAVLDRLAAEVKRVTKPDGLVIAAGFIKTNTPAKFVPQEELQSGDWLCWICRPQHIQDADSMESTGGLTHIAEWWL